GPGLLHDLARRLRRILAVDVGDQDACAFRRQARRDGLADAARPAGDDGDAVLQPPVLRHGPLPPLRVINRYIQSGRRLTERKRTSRREYSPQGRMAIRHTTVYFSSASQLRSKPRPGLVGSGISPFTIRRSSTASSLR